MALPVYLAMTAAEFSQNTLPSLCAWMSCHFSPYGLGLSNLPSTLPEGCLLILNDRTPVNRHDPDCIAEQLKTLVEDFSASGVLLDLQRPGNSRTAAVVQAVVKALACPVAVTEYYAEGLSCAVFLEAPRPYYSLSRQVEKWPNRELWLEASYSPCCVTITPEGSRYEPEAAFPQGLPEHREKQLCCSYCIQKNNAFRKFFLHRTQEDLAALLIQAQALGITRAIGLYQELTDTF